MIFIKSGTTMIEDAVKSFSKITTQLEEGMKLAAGERTKQQDDLVREREAFKAKELTIEAEIKKQSDAISQALRVKNNLGKLLTGEL